MAKISMNYRALAHENHFFISVIILLDRTNYLDNIPSL